MSGVLRTLMINEKWKQNDEQWQWINDEWITDESYNRPKIVKVIAN
jgi:hypothetical protein